MNLKKDLNLDSLLGVVPVFQLGIPLSPLSVAYQLTIIKRLALLEPTALVADEMIAAELDDLRHLHVAPTRPVALDLCNNRLFQLPKPFPPTPGLLGLLNPLHRRRLLLRFLLSILLRPAHCVVMEQSLRIHRSPKLHRLHPDPRFFLRLQNHFWYENVRFVTFINGLRVEQRHDITVKLLGITGRIQMS